MHNRFAVLKIRSWTLLNSFYVSKKNPAELRGIFCSKSKRLIFVFFDRRLRFLLTLVRIERDLAEAESHRGHFDAFVIIDERDAFFEGHAAVRRELNVIIGSLARFETDTTSLKAPCFAALLKSGHPFPGSPLV